MMNDANPKPDVLDGLEGFTPGPWVLLATRFEPSVVIDQATNYVIATGIRDKDDARLIARAPDLVAEVKRLRAKLAALAEGDPAGELRTIVDCLGEEDRYFHKWTLNAIADAIDQATSQE